MLLAAKAVTRVILKDFDSGIGRAVRMFSAGAQQLKSEKIAILEVEVPAVMLGLIGAKRSKFVGSSWGQSLLLLALSLINFFVLGLLVIAAVRFFDLHPGLTRRLPPW